MAYIHISHALRMVRAAIVAGAWCCTGMLAAAQNAPSRTDSSADGDPPPRPLVSGDEAVRRIVGQLRTRRVDWVVNADSNGAITAPDGSSGHADGVARALHELVGLYGSAAGAPSTGSFGNPNTRSGWATSGASDSQTLAQLPPPQREYLFTDSAGKFTNAGFSWGARTFTQDIENDTNPDSFWGVRWNADEVFSHPLLNRRPYRMHLTFLRDAERQGVVWPQSGHTSKAGRRFGETPAPVTIPAGVGPFDVSYDVNLTAPDSSSPDGLATRDGADERGMLIHPISLADATNPQLLAPVVLIGMRAEATDVPTGAAVSLVYSQGGRSARTLSMSTQASTRTAWIERYRQYTRLQGREPVLVMHIIHGGNDANDSNRSYGLGGVKGDYSDTEQGHYENLRAIIETHRAHWAAAGLDLRNLYFVLGPYHPKPDFDSRLREFERAWGRLVNDYPGQVAAVFGASIAEPEQFLQLGWYRLGLQDTAHLTVAGYRGWAQVWLNRFFEHADDLPPTPDFTFDGRVDGADFGRLLGAWGPCGAPCSADLNGDGVVDGADLGSLLGAWSGV